MGELSAIEWTDHTFNPWWGCTKVSPACDNCYADALAHRYGFDVWGKNAPRRVLSDDNWRKPLRWDRQAAEAGRPALVFCASMADVFEDRRDLDEHRARLWDLIDETPHLIWQLLTKRPEHVLDQVPDHWKRSTELTADGATVRHPSLWPANVWIGTTVENQRQADRRITHLVDIPAPVRFLSCEPLLGPLDLTAALAGRLGANDDVPIGTPDVHWVIAGGESGPGARPTHPDWFRQLRDQVTAAGVPWFFKQWGDWVPYEEDPQPPFWDSQHGDSIDSHHTPVVYRRVGKVTAGAVLDGRTWREFPPEAQR